MSNLILQGITAEDLSKLIAIEIQKLQNQQPAPIPAPTTETSEKYLSAQEAAKFLKLALPTIYSKHSRGELPGVSKRGKRLYFSKKILLEWLEDGRQKSTAEIEAEADLHLSNLRKKIRL